MEGYVKHGIGRPSLLTPKELQAFNRSITSRARAGNAYTIPKLEKELDTSAGQLGSTATRSTVEGPSVRVNILAVQATSGDRSRRQAKHSNNRSFGGPQNHTP